MIPDDDRLPDEQARLAANREMWDERVPLHLVADLHDVPSFRAGRSTLPDLEVQEVGPVDGRTLLHLQCHFGLDTLSWARLGASVTGLDFSGEAVRTARELASDVGIEAEFVEANVFDAPQALGGRQFDLVYTAAGVLGWLPDVDRWARAAAASVRPGGVFYLREFHHMAWIFDDAEDVEELRVAYPYWTAPLAFNEAGSYATSAPTVHNQTYEWTHSLGEVVTALAANGLQLEFLHEHDWSTFKMFPFLVEEGPHRWVLPEHRGSVPLMYSIRARKPA
jgi:2-polyprenyl-3-methyl-5-hydroxy-6-metoxy-1,4-benzoquinol methylase